MAVLFVINTLAFSMFFHSIIFVECKSNGFRGLSDENFISSGDFVTEVKKTMTDELMLSLISELKAELRESLKDEIRRDIKNEMLHEVREQIYKTVKAELLDYFDTLFYDKAKTQLKATMEEQFEQKMRSGISELERKHCCVCPFRTPSAVNMSSNVTRIPNSSYTEKNVLKQQDNVSTPLNCTTSYTKQDFLRHEQDGRQLSPLQAVLSGQKHQDRGIRAISNIAFSAYLDHSIQHLADGTTVKFNRILLNDGGAYNRYTGVFTAPTSGVYMFAFEFLSSSRTTLLRLVANSVNEVDGKVEYGNAGTFGLQGGNIALLKLSQGHSVWVENYKVDGAVVDAGNSNRFTTFSGLWLY